MAMLYRRAAFVCLTSNFEGLPLSLTEGQQYGAIPVSFDSYAGIREITEEGACRLIVPPFGLRRYAATLIDAMEDTARQERMRSRSKRPDGTIPSGSGRNGCSSSTNSDR